MLPAEREDPTHYRPRVTAHAPTGPSNEAASWRQRLIRVIELRLFKWNQFFFFTFLYEIEPGCFNGESWET